MRLLARYWYLTVQTAVVVASLAVTLRAIPEPRPWWLGLLAVLVMWSWGLALGYYIRHAEARRVQPEPPENVRAVMADGEEIPLEFVYLGKRDGFHQWQAVWVIAERPVSIRGGTIPARTAVSIAWKVQP